MAGGNNPIGFSDLFNFSDRKEVLDALELIRDLRKSYNDFINDVTGAATSKFSQSQSNIAEEISKVAKASQDLNITNQQSQKTLLDNLKVIEQLRKENEALRKAKEGAKTTEDALAGSVDGLTKNLNEQVAAWRKVDQSTEQGRIQAQKLGMGIRDTKNQIAQLNEQTKITTTTFNAAKGSYAALDAETKKLVQDLKNLEGGMGKNNAVATEMQKRIFDNTQKLKDFDAMMNQNFRNVGNYKSAFSGLNFSVAQLTRELPSLAINAQTFFLAISNNLPIMVDQIKLLQERNKILVADGQKAVPVWKAVAGAFFSWQTAMSFGITFLTLYGKQVVELIGSMFKAGGAIDQMRHKQKLMNELRKETLKGASDEIAKLEILYKVATTNTFSIKERKKAVDELQELYPDYFKNIKDEIILQGKAADAYALTKLSILEAAKTRAIENKLAKLANDELDLLQQKEELFRKRNKNALDQAKANAAPRDTKEQREDRGLQQFNAISEGSRINKKLGDLNIELDQIAKDREFLMGKITSAGLGPSSTKGDKDGTKELEAAVRKMEDLIKASTALQLAQVELVFARSAKSAQDEIDLEEHKLKILKESFALRSALYKKGSKDQLEIATEQAKAEKEYADAILKIKDKEIERVVKLQIQELNAIYEKTNKGYNAEIEFETKRLAILLAGYDQRLALYKKDSDEYKQALADKVSAEAAAAARIKAIREAQKRGGEGVDRAVDDLTDAAQVADFRRAAVGKGESGAIERDRQIHQLKMSRLAEEIAAKEAAFVKLKAGDADYYETLKVLTDLRKKALEEEANYEIAQAERAAEKKKEVQQAAFDFAVSTMGYLFDLQRQFSENNIDRIQREKERELTLAGSNATARARIEENFQKKIIEQKRKQAIFDKLQALFDIGINTAVAVMKSVKESPTTFGLPFSAFAIATGALQAALVLAKPLPKYFKGRGKGKAEWAWLNEQGTELLEKDGKFRVANEGKKGVGFVKEGEVVHTADKTKKLIDKMVENNDHNAFIDSLLQGTGVVRAHEQAKEQRLINALVSSHLSPQQLKKAFGEAIEEMPFTSLSIDEKGVHKFAHSMSGKTELMNSRNSFGGNG